MQNKDSNQETKNRKLSLFPLLASIPLFCLTGCQILTYTAPTGERFTRSSLGATTSIHSLVLEATTNGLRRVELRGYENDSTKALGVVTESAVRGAIQGLK